MDEPKINFQKWEKWIYRERLRDEIDVPEDFGLLGVYLLASPLPNDSELFHLSPEIIYIGMSTHVTKRLDKSHKVVRKYLDKTGDKKLENLYYSCWISQWSNWDKGNDIGKARNAFMHYTERRLIWEYAKKHHRLPLFNRY